MEDEKPQEETSAQPGEIAEEDLHHIIGLVQFCRSRRSGARTSKARPCCRRAREVRECSSRW